jgi:hypothetical protein
MSLSKEAAMSRKIQFVCLFVLLGLLSTATRSGFAQADPPLTFANNYFVRGDYTVAGATGMTSNFTTINGTQYAVGKITVPDPNPGIKPSGITGNGSNAVPTNAEVIAAVLYWQTVEKVGITPGQPGSGQIGFFRPLVTNGPQLFGYQITGVPLSSPGINTVSWSAGGCTTGSTGKVIRTYRANVLGALPRDTNGNISANITYEVRLPGTSSTTPIAVGASLVLIYRILNPAVPLNSIVIYDGDFAPSNTSLFMMQTMQGFYDAAHRPVSRLTHIVGNGKAKKFETVYLNNVPLPSLYPSGQPPFPGYYGAWDNPTWTFDPNKTYVNLSNPVAEDSASVTTQVSPASMQQGCVSWGAAIVSTTVKNTDGDGLLDAWKKAPTGYQNPGYCDAAVNEGVCTPGSASWVDLPGAVLGTPANPHPDVFIQLDYMCSQVTGPNSCTTGDGINYSFDPTLQTDLADGKNAIQKVVAAYAAPAHNITLHVNPPGTNQPNVHTIQEPYCQDTTVNGQPSLCAFPNVQGTSANMGVVAWAGGFYFLKGQLIDPDDPTNPKNDCSTSPPAADCIPRFQPAAAHSKHYLVFGHAVGQPKWALVGGTLTSVMQSVNNNTVTFTTSTPVGTLNVIGTYASGNPVSDPTCPNGRVTVFGAASNPNLNGTFCVSSAQGNSFTITVGGSPRTANYRLTTDPNLAVAPGFTSTASGVADVGGANSYHSLGLWGNPAFNGQTPATSPASDGQKPSVIAGTIMHEFGHANGLAHGGPAALVAQNLQTFQSVITNCKPNYLSSMSYSRQVEGPPDYSGQILTDLNKSTQTGALNSAANTSWYVPWPLKDSNGTTIVDSNGNPIGTPAKTLCPGGPIPNGVPSMMRATGPANTFSFLSKSQNNNPDINFDGDLSEDLQGADDWHNLDLAQLDATGAISSSSGPQFGGGGGQFGGGGGQFGGGGGQFGGGGGQFGGGGGQFGGGGGQFGGGGGQFGGGGGQFGGGGEIDVATVNSLTRPPQNLTASEGASPRTITLNWTAPTFGQIGAYNVYRSKNGAAFTLINPPNTVTGNPPATTFTDTVACDPGGYRYFVTAVLSSTSANPGQESVPGNTVPGPTQDLLTGCYIVTNFSSPASAVQGTFPTITWTLTDDFYTPNNPVTNPNASTLVAIGPVSTDSCAHVSQGRTTLLLNGQQQGVTGTLSQNVNQFNFAWNTDAFCAGSYSFELDLDSHQSVTTASPLQLQIDVNDSDTNPHVTTMSLPDATVGVGYSDTFTQDGGTPPFTWGLASGSGPLPPGVVLDSATGKLHGTPIVPTSAGVNFTAQLYNFTVQVTDSAGNVGTQALTLRLITAVSLNRTDYATGNKPYGVVAADFNNDGKLDLAIANRTDNTVSILHGNGDGTFTAQSTFATGNLPYSLAAGDFNGDGKQDLVVTNFNDGNVSVFLGNGDGTFQSPVAYTIGLGGTPVSVVTGNFNGDSSVDLAVANQNDASVYILLNNNDHTGTFQGAVRYPAGTTDVAAVATGDFDGDGKLDLALANPSSDTVSVLLGNGDGTFQAAVPYATGNLGDHPIAVSAVDFNGDGKLDLAVTNLNAKTVAILLGNGDGTFPSRVSYPTTNGMIGPSAMTSGDLNGDGKVDLVISDQEDNSVSILLGNGDGTFQRPLEFTTGNFAAGVAAADFNGDVRLDLAVVNNTDGTVSVMLHLPQPPTNVAASLVTTTQVTLAWTASASANVTGYNVKRVTTSGGPYTFLAHVTGSGFTDTPVTHGTAYYYVVTAVDANGLESVVSNEVPATP